MAMMNRGGVLVSDNVLQEGRIALSRFAIDRRNEPPMPECGSFCVV